MAKVDFSGVDEGSGGGKPIPEGQYKCKVDKVTLQSTQKGDEMWLLELVVTDGDYAGRKVFDRIVFSAAAYPRAKLVLGRLGQDVSGIWEGEPDCITGVEAFVTVEMKEYQDRDGNTKETNAVAFGGYEAVPDMDGDFKDQF